jgi:hypothetical protein
MEVNPIPSSSTIATKVLLNASEVYMYAMLSSTASQPPSYLRPSYLGILAWYDGLLGFVGDILLHHSIRIPSKLILALVHPPVQALFCRMLMKSTCMLC